jgi:hypothetical protein
MSPSVISPPRPIRSAVDAGRHRPVPGGAEGGVVLAAEEAHIVELHLQVELFRIGAVIFEHAIVERRRVEHRLEHEQALDGEHVRQVDPDLQLDGGEQVVDLRSGIVAVEHEIVLDLDLGLALDEPAHLDFRRLGRHGTCDAGNRCAGRGCPCRPCGTVEIDHSRSSQSRAVPAGCDPVP